ncbi:hypothetical protein ILYODFUR_012882 [Ilyodon furcidens]|uniref:Secreted protein n=1 Tax=Ilyodon furcidens TaxID=33524 RepID=A0ABV0TI60_9TELE
MTSHSPLCLFICSSGGGLASYSMSSPAPQPDPDRQLPSCERRSYTSPEELKFHTNSPSKANRCSSSTKTRKSPETTSVPLRNSGWCKRVKKKNLLFKSSSV